jgi:hypothetical protein
MIDGTFKFHPQRLRHVLCVAGFNVTSLRKAAVRALSRKKIFFITASLSTIHCKAFNVSERAALAERSAA